MKTLTFLLVFQLCCLVVSGLLFQEQRNPAKIKLTSNPLQPKRTDKTRVTPPKYILQLYKENLKHGKSVNNLHCIFPKIMQTKRAIKLIFKNNSFRENKKWKRDELRLFMTTAKNSISSSNKPYHLKIFDLYSRKMVNIYKLSSKDFGWKTINISAWRSVKPRQDSRGRFGLKIVVVLGKKKLSINKTAFRKARNRKQKPYFIEFFHERDEKIDTFQANGKSSFQVDRSKKNNALPASKYDMTKRDYYLPFQRYEFGWSLD